MGRRSHRGTLGHRPNCRHRATSECRAMTQAGLSARATRNVRSPARTTPTGQPQPAAYRKSRRSTHLADTSGSPSRQCQESLQSQGFRTPFGLQMLSCGGIGRGAPVPWEPGDSLRHLWVTCARQVKRAPDASRPSDESPADSSGGLASRLPNWALVHRGFSPRPPHRAQWTSPPGFTA